MNVLVIAAHPDDEAIGCGGSIILHARAGDEVHSLFLTSGEQGRGGDDPEETGRMREREVAIASQTLGTKGYSFARFPDGTLGKERREGALTEEGVIASDIIRLRPERIFCPQRFDAHPDHLAAYMATRAALERVRSLERVERWRIDLMEYEVWTPMMEPNSMQNIGAVLGDKLAAIRAHRSQCERQRFDMAAYGLAMYRGEMSQVGVFAEAFVREEFSA